MNLMDARVFVAWAASAAVAAGAKLRGPEASLVPNTSSHGTLQTNLEAELDGVMSLAAQWPEEADMDMSSVEKMEEAVTDLVTNVDGATPMGNSVKEIKDLIKTTMMPKVLKASRANQKELTQMAEDISNCDGKKDADEKAAEIQKRRYLQASPAHKACRTREATLATEAQSCGNGNGALKQIRDLKCKALQAYETAWGQQAKNAQIIVKGGGETPKIYMKRLHDTYCGEGGESFYDKYIKLEQECKEATEKYKGLADGCKQVMLDYRMKKTECDNIQAQMDGAACNRAVLIKDSCESYAECFNTRRISYMNAKKVVKQAEEDRKAEWRALKRMVCLIDAFSDGKVMKSEVKTCKSMDHNTDDLNLEYPGVPEQQPCVVPNRYPATAAYKKAEFAPLPALAKGQIDANECYGVLEISTKPKSGSPPECKCQRVTLNGPFSPGALVKCMDCNDVYRSDDKDSCPEGTKIFSPRSRSDWRTFLASAGPLRAPNWIVDITRPQQGCGGCQKAPMNSNEKKQSSWLTRDGSPWWLRSTVAKEPSGDYDASCYLDLSFNTVSEDDVKFNDLGCNSHSRSYYCQQKMISTTPKHGSPEGCQCERVELTGRYSPGALLKCTGCLRVSRSTDKDSCPEGTKLFSPRSREDWKTILDSAGPLRAPNWIVDVTQPRSGCAGCTKAAMNFENAKQAAWRTQDGSPWWLRSTKYTEPNGDYEANCYMDLWKVPNNPDSITFNDGGCSYNANSYYCQPRLAA